MAKIFNGKAENLLVVYSYIRKQTLTLSGMVKVLMVKGGGAKNLLPLF